MYLRIASVLAGLCVSVASAADWPQWRGPNRDGLSAEKGLPKAWPKGGPQLAWQIDDATLIGTGYGSPAIVGDKAFLIGANGAKQTAKEFCTCIETKTGTKVWQTALTTTPGSFNDGWGGGPRSTPTVEGDFVYILGSTGDLVCLTADKGTIVWSKNLVKDFGGKIPVWGYSESPLIDGDWVLVTPGSKTGMVALEKKTGKTVWVCDGFNDVAGYSSIIAAEIGGVRQYVQQTMNAGVGVRAKDGKLLWKAGEIGRKVAVIPTPIVADGYVFYTSGYGAGCECFKLEKDGDGTKATKVYSKNTVLANHHGGVVRVGEHVYGHTDSGGSNWVCFEFKKGGDEPLWKAKGVGKGSVTLAEGLLYCYSEKDGTLALVKATPEKYEEISRFTIPAKSKLRPSNGLVWPHPVVANGKLYLRDYEKMFVYDIAAK